MEAPIVQLMLMMPGTPATKIRCKILLRGYEAALILQGNGYTNVKVLEGGIMAWPWAREK